MRRPASASRRLQGPMHLRVLHARHATEVVWGFQRPGNPAFWPMSITAFT